MDFPKKQAQRLMPLYLLEYSEKLFTNHPNPEDPWGGGSDYTAGQGITITNNEISVDTNVIATKSDIPSLEGYATEQWVQNQGYATSSEIPTNYVTLDTAQTISGPKRFSNLQIFNPEDSGTLDVNCNSLFFNNPSIINTKESFSIYASTENYGPGFSFSTEEENPTINYYVFPHLDLPGEHHYTLATTDDIITSYNDLTDKPTIPDASNFVTTNTEQTIDGSKTFSSNVYIKSTNSTTSLGLEDYTLYFDNTSSGEIFQILPYKNFWGPGFYYGVGKDDLATNYYELPHQDLPGEYHYTLATTNDIPSLTGYATETWVQNQGYATSSSLATVATSGNYNDLTNKPTIPDAVSGTNDGTNWTTLTIGNSTYDIPQGGSAPGMIGEVIYSSPSGSTALTLTMSHSFADYSYVDIQWVNNDGLTNSTRIYEPNGKTVILLSANVISDWYFDKAGIYSLSGTAMTQVSKGQGAIQNGNKTNIDYKDNTQTSDYIKITKVIGYKSNNSALTTEQWTFTLSDGTTVTKNIVVL